MITVTGTVVNTSEANLRVVIEFKSLSTPLVRAQGQVIGKTTTKIRNNSGDGSFSIDLVAGDYLVTYYTKPEVSQFRIAVPNGDGEKTIDELVSSQLVYTYAFPPALVALANLPNSNIRLRDGVLQIYDPTAAAADPNRPWRALGVINGQTVLSDPIQN